MRGLAIILMVAVCPVAGCGGDSSGDPVCGDDVVDPGEACDDGNTEAGDGCDAVCRDEGDVEPPAVCGDGEIGGDEGCDDGNLFDDDGCDADCVPSGAVQVAAGSSHSCALLRTGNVKCWGNGGSGRLGYGSVSSIGRRLLPRDVGTVEVGGRVVQLVAGDAHTCALLDDGTARCWGEGDNGRLGRNNIGADIASDELTTPAADGIVVAGATITQISAGLFHSCTRMDGGTARCWGNAFDGQLGYGNETDVASPMAGGDVAVGGEVASIAAGVDHTCAVLVTGAVRCWGSGVDGGLGYGNENDIGDNELPSVAGDVDVGGEVADVGVGFHFSCARMTTGTVRCWGDAQFGAVGHGNTDDIGDNEAPATAGEVDVGGTVTQLAIGGIHSCALLDEGRIRCWGFNLNGQLGYGNVDTIGDNEVASAGGDVDVGGAVVHIAVGAAHTCVVLDSGAVRCWGLNNFGQLGYGNTDTSGDDETPASAGDVPLF